MDIVRYADTAGDNADYPVPELYRYRDYIIDSFNADKPYDEFVREQLAGDVSGPGGSARALRRPGRAPLVFSRFRGATAPARMSCWHLTHGKRHRNRRPGLSRGQPPPLRPLPRPQVRSRSPRGIITAFTASSPRPRFPWAEGGEEIASKYFSSDQFRLPCCPIDESEQKWQGLEGPPPGLCATKSLSLEKRQISRTKPAVESRKSLRRLGPQKGGGQNSIKPGVPPDLPAAYARCASGTPNGRPDSTQRRTPTNRDPTPRAACPNSLAGGEPLNIPLGSSGRLEFAQWLTCPSNPLVARVMVEPNLAASLWRRFGQLSQQPRPAWRGRRADPELLDYLCQPIRRQRLVGQSDAPPHHELRRLSAVQREKPPAWKTPIPRTGSCGRFARHRLECRSHPRWDALRQWRAGPDPSRPPTLPRRLPNGSLDSARPVQGCL